MIYIPKPNNSPRMMIKKDFLRRVMLCAWHLHRTHGGAGRTYHFDYALVIAWRKMKKQKYKWQQNVIF